VIKKKVLIIGGNSDISISIISKLIKDYKIQITSRNIQRLRNLFQQNENIKITSLDISNRKEIKRFVDQQKDSFDLIFCFSGSLNEKNIYNMILSNYLGIKYFIDLYFLKFNKNTKFIVLTSVAVLRNKNKSLYIKLKKKLSNFIERKRNDDYKMYNIMPGYVDTKLVDKKSLVFKLISSNPNKIASLILAVKDKKPDQYIIPIYWKYILRLYNFFF
jgi:NADP-dependent 3-hydroxy acid dehydrogenase YdfG